MTVTITHAFVSAKSDGADPTNVQPSNWNASHVLAQMPGTVLGAVAGGGGQTIELPLSIGGDGSATFGTTASVTLAVGTTGQRPITPDPGAERFNSTSKAKEYWNGTLWVTITAAVPTGLRGGFIGRKQDCPAGWVVSDGGTIGNASSNGSNRADPDTEGLFTLLYDGQTDASTPMKTSGGVIVPRATYATAALAFAANSQMSTPNYTDVFPTGAGGTNAPTPGVTGGTTQVVLITANLPQHTHGQAGPAGNIGSSGGGSALMASSGNGLTDTGTGLSLTPTPVSLLNPFIGEVAIIAL